MNTSMQVPFLDLVAPHRELQSELCAVFEAALRTGGFVGGPAVADFEQDFARFCEAGYCAGVGSGTDALRFALMAAGVGRDDAVITVPNTFIATVEAITQAGAHPVFVDVDERTYNLDPEKLREFLEMRCTMDARGAIVDRATGKRVAAVVPVHLYGQPCDMDAILEIAEWYSLPVIEDACQAHGAQYFSRRKNRWCKAGSMGRAAAFSFYPGKNLGACGEAGAVTTNDPAIAQRVRMLRDHGQARKYYHEIEGYNGRLDAIQAGILLVKLSRLDAWNQQRRQCAARYQSLFAQAAEDIVTPDAPSFARSVYHLYVLRVSEREELQKSLAEAGIGTGIHYPIPLHLQDAYQWLHYDKGSFPVAERSASSILSLPMYPQLEEEQQRVVAGAVLKFAAGRRIHQYA